MGKHRSRLQIIKCILSVIGDNHDVRKTRIMYEAYLSYALLSRYLDDVIDSGMVSCDDGINYKLTSKGVTFLTRYDEYNKSRTNVEKNLNYAEKQKAILDEMCPDS